MVGGEGWGRKVVEGEGRWWRVRGDSGGGEVEGEGGWWGEIWGKIVEGGGVKW